MASENGRGLGSQSPGSFEQLAKPSSIPKLPSVKEDAEDILPSNIATARAGDEDINLAEEPSTHSRDILEELLWWLKTAGPQDCDRELLSSSLLDDDNEKAAALRHQLSHDLRQRRIRQGDLDEELRREMDLLQPLLDEAMRRDHVEASEAEDDEQELRESPVPFASESKTQIAGSSTSATGLAQRRMHQDSHATTPAPMDPLTTTAATTYVLATIDEIIHFLASPPLGQDQSTAHAFTSAFNLTRSWTLSLCSLVEDILTRCANAAPQTRLAKQYTRALEATSPSGDLEKLGNRAEGLCTLIRSSDLWSVDHIEQEIMQLGKVVAELHAELGDDDGVGGSAVELLEDALAGRDGVASAEKVSRVLSVTDAPHPSRSGVRRAGGLAVAHGVDQEAFVEEVSQGDGHDGQDEWREAEQMRSGRLRS